MRPLASNTRADAYSGCAFMSARTLSPKCVWSGDMGSADWSASTAPWPRLVAVLLAWLMASRSITRAWRQWMAEKASATRSVIAPNAWIVYWKRRLFRGFPFPFRLRERPSLFVMVRTFPFELAR
jgi:hypothetical protein